MKYKKGWEISTCPLARKAAEAIKEAARSSELLTCPSVEIMEYIIRETFEEASRTVDVIKNVI